MGRKKEFVSARAIMPGDILREELEVREWSQADLANILGRPIQVVNEILNGKKAITPETAIGLAMALGTSPEFWLNLESSYRLQIANISQKEEDIRKKAKLYGLAPIKELIKRGWIKSTSVLDELEKELLSFFRVESLDEIPTLSARFRFSASHKPDSPSLWAWITRARNLAEGMNASSFTPEVLEKGVSNLPRLSLDEDDMASLPTQLSNMGVRLVFVPHLPRTYVDGAAFWLNDEKPVVALSIRYNRIDNFWFTLMHELAHLSGNQNKRSDYIDNDLDHSVTSGEEGRANRLAAQWLLPKKAFDQFVKNTTPYFSVRAIRLFAQRQGVHPAIVVGRLQREDYIPYSHHRGMLGKVKHIFLN